MDQKQAKLLLQALWAGVARLEPLGHEIAVGGIRYSVEVKNGLPLVHDNLAVALELKMETEAEAEAAGGGKNYQEYDHCPIETCDGRLNEHDVGEINFAFVCDVCGKQAPPKPKVEE